MGPGPEPSTQLPLLYLLHTTLDTSISFKSHSHFTEEEVRAWAWDTCKRPHSLQARNPNPSQPSYGKDHVLHPWRTLLANNQSVHSLANFSRATAGLRW
jgi:hypothetical protein